MAGDYAGDLSPREAWDLLTTDPQAQLVDVRTLPEWAFVGRPDLGGLGKSVHFVGWQLFPRMEVNPEFVGQLEAAGIEKDQPVLFICRSGQRSRFAAVALTAAGYGPCYNVAEGFEGDKDDEDHRGTVGGWRFNGLPWIQD